jgi:hypothetical protein
VVVNLVSADEAEHGPVDAEITDEVWLLRAVQARKDAMEARDRGDFDGGSSALRAMAQRPASAAPRSSRGDELAAEAALLERHAAAASDDLMLRKRLHQERWRRSHGGRRGQR